MLEEVCRVAWEENKRVIEQDTRRWRMTESQQDDLLSSHECSIDIIIIYKF